MIQNKSFIAIIFSLMLICQAISSSGHIPKQMKQLRQNRIARQQSIPAPAEKIMAINAAKPNVLIKKGKKKQVAAGGASAGQGNNGNAQGNVSGAGGANGASNANNGSANANGEACGCAVGNGTNNIVSHSRHTEKGSCEYAIQGVNSNNTQFKNTWETIGTCRRHFQCITDTTTTINEVRCKHVTADTTVNKNLSWQVKKAKKVHKKIMKKIHTHINKLTKQHVSYQRLTNSTVIIGSTGTDRVNVNYMTNQSIELQRLITSVTSKRTMTSTVASARTLTSLTVSMKKIKRAVESVSQSLVRVSKCKGTYGGKDFGILTKCGVPSSCSA